MDDISKIARRHVKSILGKAWPATFTISELREAINVKIMSNRRKRYDILNTLCIHTNEVLANYCRRKSEAASIRDEISWEWNEEEQTVRYKETPQPIIIFSKK